MLRKKVTEGRTAGRTLSFLIPTFSLQGLALSPLGTFPKPLPPSLPLCAASSPAEPGITPKGPLVPSHSTSCPQVLPFHWRGNPAPERGSKHAERETREPLPSLCCLASVFSRTKWGTLVALLLTATMGMMSLVSSPRDLGGNGEAFCQRHPLRQLGLFGTIWMLVITISKSCPGPLPQRPQVTLLH